MSRWIPLESNPEVLNTWAKKAGLNEEESQFSDIYGLDEELLAMVPKPVKAVLLLFPISKALEARRREEDEKIRSEVSVPSSFGSMIWIKQTIPNACGTIGLLHALANVSSVFMPRKWEYSWYCLKNLFHNIVILVGVCCSGRWKWGYVALVPNDHKLKDGLTTPLQTGVKFTPESPLAQFIEACKDKTPEERARFLETTPLFAEIHAETASTGQSTVPTDLNTDLHFTCFVETEVEGVPHVVELDGRRTGIMDRGKILKDLLTDVASLVKETYIKSSSGSIQFSMTSLGPPSEW